MNKIIPYFFIGISILVTFCEKKTVEPTQHAKYVYTNRLTTSVLLEIYDKHNNSSTIFDLKNGESISFSYDDEFPYPFKGSPSTASGDTVVIGFSDNKCTTYTLDLSSGTQGGDGVFNLKEYDNYSSALVQQDYYELHYTIDSTDYKRAVDCAN